MSAFIRTPFGVIMRVSADGTFAGLLLARPGCQEWITLSDDQAHGRVSVDHASDGCAGGYHETHDFSVAVGGDAWREAPWEYGTLEDANLAVLAFVTQGPEL